MKNIYLYAINYFITDVGLTKMSHLRRWAWG